VQSRSCGGEEAARRGGELTLKARVDAIEPRLGRQTAQGGRSDPGLGTTPLAPAARPCSPGATESWIRLAPVPKGHRIIVLVPGW
jgi:hypothetical protein